MDLVTIADLTGNIEPLTGIKEIVRNRKVNGEKTVKTTVLPTSDNTASFPLVQEESTLDIKGEEYVIKILNEHSIGNFTFKQGEAVHKAFDDLLNQRVEDTVSGTLSILEAANFIFNGSEYSVNVIDAFAAETWENLGNKNRRFLLKELLEKYEAEFTVSGKTLTIRKQIGAITDFQFRYNYNIKTIERTVNTQNLSTKIKGYGKEHEDQTILKGKYNPSIDLNSGKWESATQPYIFTQVVDTTFSYTFTGCRIDFQYWGDNLGGVWEFSLSPGGKKATVSTWKESGAWDIVPIFDGLEEREYTVTAIFKGADPNHKAKEGEDPKRGYVAYSSDETRKTFHVYRNRVGDERYMAVAEYLSPNWTIYGIRDADPIQDDQFTDNASLLEHLEKIIQDVPEVSITLDFIDLRKAGYPFEIPNEGDTVDLIYEPMKDVDITTRIMEIEETLNENLEVVATKVTIGNYKKDAAQTQFDTVQKQLGSIVRSDGKIRYNVMDEAVKIATEAIKSAQTQLVFENGIKAVDKNDPNRIVVFNSAGLGISTDGGNEFRNAITYQGIVTDLLTAGQIKTNHIFIVGEDDLFFWDGNYLKAVDADDSGKYVQLNSSGLLIEKGAVTIKRSDGFAFVIDGIPQMDLDFQETSPSFLNPAVVTHEGYFWTTQSTEVVDCAYFSFLHTSRYLKVSAALLAEEGGTTTLTVETGMGADRVILTSATETRFEETVGGYGKTLIYDMGVPTGLEKGVYLRLKSSDPTKKAKARKIRIGQGG